MTAQIGQTTLILALLAGIAQMASPFAWKSRHAILRRLLPPFICSAAAFAFVCVSFVALVFAHVFDDFGVLNVYMNGHTLKPLLYKITGVWGNHEGSMMLWLLILSGYSFFMAFGARASDGGQESRIRALASAVMGAMLVGFTVFVILTSDPFVRIWPVPFEGRDLNPLLQDIGLAVHPPLLYLGYVGFAAAFAFAAAGMLEKADWEKWAETLRPWLLTAWGFMTLGLVSGSWWAYYELGWGGWWFWDPVENAALMPWLTGTALLHSNLALRRSKALATWTMLLAVVTFGLSLLGLFMVRSGVLTSVHSFASDPERGIFLMALFAIYTGGGLSLFAFRAVALPPSPSFDIASRETAVLAGNCLLCAACAVVLTGTLYPMILDALGGGMVSVGAPYFNSSALPFLLPLVFVMAIGPMLGWRRSSGASGAAKRLVVSAALGIAAGIIVAFSIKDISLAGIAAFVFGAAGFAGNWGYGWKKARSGGISKALRGASLAHGGLALAVLGMAGASAGSSHNVRLAIGETARIEDYDITFAGQKRVDGANYESIKFLFDVKDDDGKKIAVMSPERRFYPSQGMELSETAIKSSWRGDIYLVVDEAPKQGDSKISLRAQINPLVPWMWAGGAIMAAAAFLSAAAKRAPARSDKKSG